MNTFCDMYLTILTLTANVGRLKQQKEDQLSYVRGTKFTPRAQLSHFGKRDTPQDSSGKSRTMNASSGSRKEVVERGGTSSIKSGSGSSSGSSGSKGGKYGGKGGSSGSYDKFMSGHERTSKGKRGSSGSSGSSTGMEVTVEVSRPRTRRQLIASEK